jgi:hypothetical protein
MVSGHEVEILTWNQNSHYQYTEVWVDSALIGTATDCVIQYLGARRQSTPVSELIDLWFRSPMRDTLSFSEFYKGLDLER